MELVGNPGVVEILSHTFPLDQINEAFREHEGGHITRGAIVPN
jgi:hypothetical protein